MRRHPDNSNLVLHTDSLFRGYPVMVQKGKLIANYLAILLETMCYALALYPRVFAFRCDLRFPAGMMLDEVMLSNAVLGRFFDSVKAKIHHNRAMARKASGYAHPCKVFYVWAREVGEKNGRVHYHVAFFLNADAFFSLGDFSSGRQNLGWRLIEAWASALRISPFEAMGLVEFPPGSAMRLRRGDTNAFANFFYRASYLCKSETKDISNGVHAFGGNRTK